MKEYENKSLEELRFEDYTANRKGLQFNSALNGFGASAQTDNNKAHKFGAACSVGPSFSFGTPASLTVPTTTSIVKFGNTFSTTNSNTNVLSSKTGFKSCVPSQNCTNPSSYDLSQGAQTVSSASNSLLSQFRFPAADSNNTYSAPNSSIKTTSACNISTIRSRCISIKNTNCNASISRESIQITSASTSSFMNPESFNFNATQPAVGGFGTTAAGIGTYIKFIPPTGTDTMEVKLKDCTANQKGLQAGSTSSRFATSTQMEMFYQSSSTSAVCFGTQTKSCFISSACGARSFGTTASAGPNFGSDPLSDTNNTSKNTITRIINVRYQCITFMNEYADKSFEELRLEDYAENRKGPQIGGCRTSAQTCSFGQSSAATSSFTSGTSQTRSSFGATARTSTANTILRSTLFTTAAGRKEDEEHNQKNDLGLEVWNDDGLISCPVCFDDAKTILAENRRLMVTVCGHFHCETCLIDIMTTSKQCSKCRKKLKKSLFHPVYL